MADKTMKIRLVLKHDTEENWAKAANFVPKKGEVIIYDGAVGSPSRVKIGDGTTKVNDLPFTHEYLLDNANTFTQIQTFPAEGINVGSVHLTETALQALETESEKIANKVDKVTSNNQVYSTDSAGSQSSLTYSQNADANSIVQRKSDGTITVATPTQSNDATTKAYVDSLSTTVKENAYQVVAELPQSGEEGIMYLVPISESEDNYRKYIWENNKFISVGDTSVININLDGDWSSFIAALTTGQKFDLWLSDIGSVDEGNKIYNSIDPITNFPAPAKIRIGLSSSLGQTLDCYGIPYTIGSTWGYTGTFFGALDDGIFVEFIYDFYVNSADDTIDAHLTGQLRTSIQLAAENAVLNSGITKSKVNQYDAYSTTKQNKLTAGKGISIAANTISCTVDAVDIPITATNVIIDLK